MIQIKPSQQKIELLQREWLKRPREKRKTENDILMFYVELRKDNSALLNLVGVGGDLYAYLKTILELNHD